MKIPALKGTVFLALGLMDASIAFSQTNAPLGAAAQMNLDALAAGGNSATVRLYDNRYEGLKGSPFFMDAWAPGQIELKAGNTGKTQIIKDLQLKYDVFSNLLVAVSPNSKDTLQISTSPVISFSLNLPTGGNPLEFRRISEAQAFDPTLANEFFAVLHDSKDGKVALVKRIAKKKVEANFKGPYSAGQTYDELVNETNYYVVANGKMQRVKLNKKSMVEALPNQADKLKAYISSQKLSMSSEADLIKVASYYQTL
ncbi:hypothetical protein [Rufibacter latericius]|uniref:Uncharacterized protein n=1 Tax=Rufibacter latericius TaxID=2487040 RepID=A0A3M9MZY8_9BACT|nr:hypothetical protein [Rufibacter latericius]RNI30677.1 hypothetical protein EFB08_05360 [Rufibacter latericius]